MTNSIQDTAQTATAWLARRLQSIPGTALVLGSGLGDWLQESDIRLRIPYAEIPGFPVSTVQGHSGALLLAAINGAPVLVFSGRFHLYEGYTAQQVTLPVRCARLLGVRRLILTTAAGALNPLFATGGLMMMTDHINMTGANPLTGPNVEAWGPRFPDMSQVYCPRLRQAALDTALACGLRLEQGVHVAIAGPSLETPAETRMLRLLGADSVSMSAVPDAIAAHHMGLRVLGFACLTNKNLPDCMAQTSFAEILDQAGRCAATLEQLLSALIPNLENTRDGYRQSDC